ncbi:MAG TPA: hypothetical protein VFE07_14365 [Marmoricola sp.]|nr:hypothetical protein [Marmoricola sp.]
MHLTALRAPSALVTLAGLALALVVGVLVATPPAARAIGWSPLVDAPSSYDGQTTCTRTPAPGTIALAAWLQRTYPVTGSLGMMRACNVGGRSEHKDGRAFDWAADVRRKRQKRAAYDFIRKALATDSAGNAHALARRMGIMYLIYNDTIWASYRDFAPRPYLNPACKTLTRCSRTLRHKNHVHISLGLAGAAAQTSWYRAREVPSRPVLHPGTNELDADLTAVTGLTVPATGATTTSTFVLRAGVTYRLVATGTVRQAAGALGDATCTTGSSGSLPSPRGTVVVPPDTGDGFGAGVGGWSDHEGSDHPASPWALPVADTSGLLVNGALRWEGGCSADHTYETWFTPTTRQRLQLRYADPVLADDAGALTVYVARDDITRASLVR